MNLEAIQGLVALLRGEGRIPPEGDAVVQICLSLARAVDEAPDNASLWREFRQAEAALRDLTKTAGSEFDDVIAALQASVPDATNGGSPHTWAETRSNS